VTYSVQAVAFVDLTELVDETISTGAFIERRDDADEPFLRAIPEIFGDEPDFRCFATFDNGDQPVGYVTIFPNAESDALDIGPLYVRKQCRGRGLGRRLMESALEYAREKGVQKVYTATWGENLRVRRLFESLGFEYIRTIPDARINGDSTVEYVLLLTNHGT
jgi:ribosomal protein S18 acetylase RimI-like enzyme